MDQQSYITGIAESLITEIPYMDICKKIERRVLIIEEHTAIPSNMLVYNILHKLKKDLPINTPITKAMIEKSINNSLNDLEKIGTHNYEQEIPKYIKVKGKFVVILGFGQYSLADNEQDATEFNSEESALEIMRLHWIDGKVVDASIRRAK